MPRAAVCTALGEPLEVLDLELEEPRAGEIKVRIGASGICASDVSVQKGNLPSPLPIVLGHEAAGVVTAIGAEVEAFAEGDHVIVAAMPQCGECYRCARGQPNLCERGDGVLISGGLMDGTSRFKTAAGADVRQFVATGTFAEEVVIPSISAARIPDDIAFAPASLIGCAVLTGAGAALNTASIRPDDTVVVLGCGSVGLCAIQGARLAGAHDILAVDLVPAKLELARSLGASGAINPGDQDVVEAVREHTGGRGANVTIEAIGIQATVDQAIRMTGRGGEVVFVGAGNKDTRVDVRQFSGLVSVSKTFKGCLYGWAHVQRDVAYLIERYQAGEFELDRLVSRRFTIDEINEGFAALGAGDVISAVVEF
jgi:Zn-dependent alcohol dehydrogenase